MAPNKRQVRYSRLSRLPSLLSFFPLSPLFFPLVSSLAPTDSSGPLPLVFNIIQSHRLLSSFLVSVQKNEISKKTKKEQKKNGSFTKFEAFVSFHLSSGIPTVKTCLLALKLLPFDGRNRRYYHEWCRSRQ